MMHTKSIYLLSFLLVLIATTVLSAPTEATNELLGSPDLQAILSDLTHTDDQAANDLVKVVAQYLGSDVALDATDPQGRIVALLSYQNYLFSSIQVKEINVQAESDKIMNELIAEMKRTKKEVTNPSERTNAIVKLVQTANAKFIEVLRLANLNELVHLLTKDAQDLEMTQYNDNAKRFLRKVSDALKTANEDFGNQDPSTLTKYTTVRKEMFRDLTQFFDHVSSWAEQIIQAYKHPIPFLKKTFRRIFDNLMAVAERDHGSNSNQFAAVSPGGLSRLNTIAQAMSELTNVHREDYSLEELFYSLTLLTNTFAPDHPLHDNAEFHQFTNEVFQSLLNAMLPVFDYETIMKALNNFLTAKTIIYDGDEDIINAVHANYNVAPFRAALPRDDISETMQKIRLIDVILFSPIQLPEERLKTIVNNAAVLANVDQLRLQTAQYLKFLLSNSGNDEFESKLYDATLYCAASVPESTLKDNIVEILDKCLDYAHKNPVKVPGVWANTHYLAFKLTNLLYAEQESEYKTTFPKEVTQKQIEVLMSQMSRRPSLLRALVKVARAQGNPTAKSGDFYKTFLGKTMDAKVFHHFQTSAAIINQEWNDADQEGNKINLNFVNDKLHASLGLKDSFRFSGNLSRKPSFRLQVDEPQVPAQSDLKDIGGIPSATALLKGPALNYVNMVVPETLPSDILAKLKSMKFEDFVRSVDPIETTDGVEYTNVIVQVTRRDNPCYDEHGRRC